MPPDSTTLEPNAAPGPDTSAITVRAAIDADADGIIAVIEACYREYSGFVLLVDEEAPELRQPATAYARYLGNAWVATATPGNGEAENGTPEIVGFAAYAPTDAPRMARIHKLYVNKAYRGAGIGPRLSAIAEDAARAAGADIMMLYADSRFERAQRMYERYGYTRQKGVHRMANASNSVEYTYTKVL